jgi:hypothetical protein
MYYLNEMPSSLSCASSTAEGALVIRQDALDVFGKAITSLMESAPDIIAASLSKPIACRHAEGPVLKSLKQKPNFIPPPLWKYRGD